MFATIRRHTPKSSSAKDLVTGLKERLEKGFVPQLRNVQGFHGYYVITNDREVVSISIFENRTGAQESTRLSTEFVRNDPLKDKLNAPEIIEGEILVSQEALIGAH